MLSVSGARGGSQRVLPLPQGLVSPIAFVRRRGSLSHRVGESGSLCPCGGARASCPGEQVGLRLGLPSRWAGPVLVDV